MIRFLVKHWWRAVRRSAIARAQTLVWTGVGSILTGTSVVGVTSTAGQVATVAGASAECLGVIIFMGHAHRLLDWLPAAGQIPVEDPPTWIIYEDELP